MSAIPTQSEIHTSSVVHWRKTHARIPCAALALYVNKAAAALNVCVQLAITEMPMSIAVTSTNVCKTHAEQIVSVSILLVVTIVNADPVSSEIHSLCVHLFETIATIH